MHEDAFVVHGLAGPERPLVLDSPHSGRQMPPDFGSVRTVEELREGEDGFMDERFQPAAASGVPLLAALFPRTCLDGQPRADLAEPQAQRLALVDARCWHFTPGPSPQPSLETPHG